MYSDSWCRSCHFTPLVWGNEPINPQVEEDKQTRLAAKEVERRRALEKATEAFANSKSPDDAMAEIERLKSDSDAVRKCYHWLAA